MKSVNPEFSCIRMGSGPALFGLAMFYCIMINIFILLHAQAESRITGKLKEWVMIYHDCWLKKIDAKSPSLKLMAASAEPCSSFLTLACMHAATNSYSVLAIVQS